MGKSTLIQFLQFIQIPSYLGSKVGAGQIDEEKKIWWITGYSVSRVLRLYLLKFFSWTGKTWALTILHLLPTPHQVSDSLFNFFSLIELLLCAVLGSSGKWSDLSLIPGFPGHLSPVTTLRGSLILIIALILVAISCLFNNCVLPLNCSFHEHRGHFSFHSLLWRSPT